MVATFHKRPENTQWALVLVGTGFCGGLSTFSTFSYENFSLIQKGEITLFIVYTIASFAACLVGVAGGYLAIRNL
jgi:CrcB protein